MGRGWSATEYVPGQHESRGWADVIAVGERRHAALADVDRPACLDTRHTPGPPATGLPGVRSQLIHGDLGGNVLFAHDRPPAIIDFAPYWRPAAFAAAIVVANALIWEGADTSLIAAVRHIDDFPQYRLRALVYRAVTESIFGTTTDDAATAASGYQHDRYLPAVDLACPLAVGSSRR
jgi:hypothetical protein